MNLEQLIQYGSLIISIFLFILKRKGMKKFIPAGLFACFYANVVCHIAMTLNWWDYPSKFTELPVNCVVAPIMAIFWIRYFSSTLKKQIIWAFLFTSILMIFEFIIEKYTHIINYHNGYNWVHSFFLWFFSWFIWLKFHRWFNSDTTSL